MDEKIQKHIIDYFNSFEEFYNTTKNKLKDCQKCAVSINKLIVRCKNIKRAKVLDTPLQKFCGLQQKLCAKLYHIISEEAQEIRDCLLLLEELFDNLCNKHRVLNEICRNIDLTEQTSLIKGSILQPPLAQLLKFSNDTITFGSQVCAQIDIALNVLSFKKLDTVSFPDCFNILPEWKHKAPEIIAYTSYISEKQI